MSVQEISTDKLRTMNNQEANLCSVAVPGEYALSEVKKALNAGRHCVVFSNNVPLEDEREMKLLAKEKGLLCMGPDCGVANINGAALVLCGILNGKSVDTSFGMSLETGPIHANRVGDMDPTMIHFLKQVGMSEEEILQGCQKKGGLLGISGVSNDLRYVMEAAD